MARGHSHPLPIVPAVPGAAEQGHGLVQSRKRGGDGCYEGYGISVGFEQTNTNSTNCVHVKIKTHCPPSQPCPTLWIHAVINCKS